MKKPVASIDPITVFERYEQIRSRLVSAEFQNHPHKAKGLLDIADQFDAILFDSFGVLNVGTAPIPGAADVIEQLRARGLKLRVLTNAAAYPLSDALAKYRNLGFSFASEEVISSRAVAASELAFQKTRNLAILCDREDRLDEFDGVGTRWDGHDSDDFEGFLLLSGPECVEHLHDALVQALERRPRPIYVANPDLIAPRETGMTYEPGWVAHEMADRFGVDVCFFGKPYANAFEAALDGLGDVSRSRIAMVGDTLHTDILGGAAAELRTILVTDHGVLAGGDPSALIETSGIRPDFILPAI